MFVALLLVAQGASAGLIIISRGHGAAALAAGGGESELETFLLSLSTGVWTEFQTTGANLVNDTVGGGGTGNRLGYANNLACLESTKRCYAINSDDPGDGVVIMRYDEPTNTWSNPTGGPTGAGNCHQYAGLSANPATNQLYRMEACLGTSMRIMNDDESWGSTITVSPGVGEAGGMMFHPAFNRQIGLDYNFGASPVDYVTASPPFSSWGSSGISGASCTIGQHMWVVYDPSTQRLYYGGGNGGPGNRTCSMSSTGVVATYDNSPIGLDHARARVLVNPLTGVLEFFDLEQSNEPNGQWFTFDPSQSTGNQWTELNAATLPASMVAGATGTSNTAIQTVCSFFPWTYTGGMRASMCVSSTSNEGDATGRVFVKRLN